MKLLVEKLKIRVRWFWIFWDEAVLDITRFMSDEEWEAWHKNIFKKIHLYIKQFRLEYWAWTKGVNSYLNLERKR